MAIRGAATFPTLAALDEDVEEDWQTTGWSTHIILIVDNILLFLIVDKYFGRMTVNTKSLKVNNHNECCGKPYQSENFSKIFPHFLAAGPAFRFCYTCINESPIHVC